MLVHQKRREDVIRSAVSIHNNAAGRQVHHANTTQYIHRYHANITALTITALTTYTIYVNRYHANDTQALIKRY